MLLSQVDIFFVTASHCISKNMDDSSDSDCIITNVVSSEECDIDRLSKQPKIETDEDFSLTLIPGDDHCIASCFPVHFKMELIRS